MSPSVKYPSESVVTLVLVSAEGASSGKGSLRHATAERTSAPATGWFPREARTIPQSVPPRVIPTTTSLVEVPGVTVHSAKPEAKPSASTSIA